MKFKDKVVIISGATGGIGRALAERFALEECKLALFSRREDLLKEITTMINKSKSTCIYRKCNVEIKNEVKQAVQFTIDTYGKIDLAILAAGVLIPNKIDEFDSSIIEKSMKINFFGNIYFMEYLFPYMRAQKSGIIAPISTLPDKRGTPGIDAYGSSKAALSWLIESLRVEAKQKYNIDLITIKPGSVETPMIGEYHRPGSIKPHRAAEIILKGLERNKKIIQFPLTQVLMIRTRELLPVWAYDRIPVHLMKEDD
ncbi:MAG: SDR family NAD(P)-dependent oxidoreductase [Euryarchaeota archaeon]|nr:SDR family NAD(P)-dependent oxidoreductase [Euryarchaeota archaeon]